MKNTYTNAFFNKNRLFRAVAILLAATFMCVIQPIMPITGQDYVAEAATATVTATGVTTDYVNLRKAALISSPSQGVLNKGVKVTVTKEIFTSSTSTKAATRWYAVRYGNKTGYIRADLVKITKYSNTKANATDALNYRSGAGTMMTKKGTMSNGTEVLLRLSAQAAGSKDMWYRIRINGKDYYSSGAYLEIFNTKAASTLKKNTTVAKKLLAKSTNGGKTRIVYTFNKDNCRKLFSVTGYGNGMVPQGMAYTGKEYHILFGMGNGQSIVTYSTAGKRLKAVNLPYNIGKPNAMTWNPKTKLCYIFKGSTTKIYTWNPANNKLGTAYTPYSSSGIAYDRATKKMYASSLTGIRVYSSDGKFRHEKLFNKCTHSGTHYVQDCGAHGGFVFHVVSGANKFGDNYLDVYKASSGKYLGSIKLQLQSEVESIIVDNDGFVILLVNNGGTYTEHLWKTPLNVKDLG